MARFNIKKFRQEQGINPDVLSRRAGISSSELLLLESGDDVSTDTDTLQKIASVLGRKVGDLFDEERSPEKTSTWELVVELGSRAGVKTVRAEPYQDVALQVNGPAIILIVTD